MSEISEAVNKAIERACGAECMVKGFKPLEESELRIARQMAKACDDGDVKGATLEVNDGVIKFACKNGLVITRTNKRQIVEYADG